MDEADFGDITNVPAEAQAAPKFRPNVRAKPRKPSMPSRPVVPNRSVEASSEKVGALSQDNLSQGLSANQEIASSTLLGSETICDSEAREVFASDVISQDDNHGEDQNNDLCQKSTDQEAATGPDTWPPHDINGTVDLDSQDGLINSHTDDTQPIFGESSVGKSHVSHMTHMLAASTHGFIQNSVDRRTGELIEVACTLLPEHIIAVPGGPTSSLYNDPFYQETSDRFLSHMFSMRKEAEGDESAHISGTAEATAKFLPNVRRKKGKRKSVTFVVPDDSEVVAPRDTNSEDHNDIRADENLNTLPQQTAQKHCLTEELSDDGEYTDKESQYHEGALSDHGVKEQPKLSAEKLDLSMKLRNRRKEVGVSEHITNDNFDEDYAEPSAAEQDNDSADEYTAGEKQKPQRKSREKDPDKEPVRGSRRTSKNLAAEKPAQQSQQKNKSEGQSRGRKRALKDASTEQPEKKLTHRIRQKRTKEVQTLLAKPDHEIDRMKLSVMHLRLLQEARERIQSKTIPSGPSFSNQSSSLYGDTDDFDPFGDNYVNDRTENDAPENAIKLNYHSYMNRQTRARWTKSDTDLFYQGLQQFGSDFAMIQQLFPDKSRDQVRQKFKSEEKKHPMQVHDAILHRSKDNVYLKQVIKQLNIEDLQRDINSTDKQEVASNEGDTGNEVSSETTCTEDNGPNWSDDELGTHQSEVKEGDQASGNADDDDLDVFDWY
ncbi:hypothetical protein ACQ4PT_058607 [Festuca glaucescens]